MNSVNLLFNRVIILSACFGFFLYITDLNAAEPAVKSQKELWPLDDEIDTPDALLRHREPILKGQNKPKLKRQGRPKSKGEGIRMSDRPDPEQTKKDNLEAAITSEVGAEEVVSAKRSSEEQVKREIIDRPVKGLGDFLEFEKGRKQDDLITPDPLLDGLAVKINRNQYHALFH